MTTFDPATPAAGAPSFIDAAETAFLPPAPPPSATPPAAIVTIPNGIRLAALAAIGDPEGVRVLVAHHPSGTVSVDVRVNGRWLPGTDHGLTVEVAP